MPQTTYNNSARIERERDYLGGFANQANPKTLDLMFYITVLRKYKWPIVLVTALVAALAGFYAYNTTPIYGGHATLLIESQKTNIISIEDLVSSEQESLDYFGTQLVILQSRGLAERVIRKLQLDKKDTREVQNLLDTPTTTKLRQVFGGLSGWLKSTESDTGTSTQTSDSTPAINGSSELSTRTSAASSEEAYNASTDITTEGGEFNQIVNRFRLSLRVSALKNTKLVKITFFSPDPEFAAIAANTIASEYIESGLDTRRVLKNQASDWMNIRTDELKARLEQSEQTLLAFKRDNGLIDLSGDVARLSEQELILDTSELTAAKRDLADARSVYDEIQKIKVSAPALLETLPEVQNDVLVRSVKTDYGRTLRELSELKNRYGDRHPRIIDAESRLESLRVALDGHINRVVATIESDLQLQQRRVASIEAGLVRGKENIQLIGQKKIMLEALEQEVSTNRDQYNRLFNRLTETRTADGLDAANAVIAERATVPGGPIKPDKRMILALSLIGSIALCSALAFLYEYLDKTVRSTDDVERRLGTKLIGILPLVNHRSMTRKKESPVIPWNMPAGHNPFAEAVNSSRTVLSMGDRSDSQVILITSSVPDEGKSTAALNLAYSFGQTERTLLIDSDLRRPSIGNAIGKPPSTSGLSSLLIQKSSAQESVTRGVHDTFDCITAGPITNQPLQMLSSVRFSRMLEALRQHYDRIIIDSAPVHSVSDALVLSKLSDAVVYVVKSHDTKIELVRSGLSRLRESGANIAGVLVSKVDVNRLIAYSGFMYHGCYDHHGYTDIDDDKPVVNLTQEDVQAMRSAGNFAEQDLNFYKKKATRDVIDRMVADKGAIEIIDDLDSTVKGHEHRDSQPRQRGVG